jgi:hypothetical protein
MPIPLKIGASLKILFALSGALAGALVLAGCVAPVGVVEMYPSRPAMVVPPPPLVVAPAPAPYVPVYSPEAYDRYLAVAIDSDIEFIAGDTFIWFVGSDGLRQRHFYAHGDHRHELFGRRETLRADAHRHGAIPDVRPEGPRAQPAHGGRREPGGLRPDEMWHGAHQERRF